MRGTVSLCTFIYIYWSPSTPPLRTQPLASGMRVPGTSPCILATLTSELPVNRDALNPFAALGCFLEQKALLTL